MSRAETKAARLIEIENILLAHPEGMTQAKIAERLGVNRSTVNRYLPDLPKHIYVDDDGRWRIDRSADLINVRFNLHEALAVHLASRLLATRMDRQNPHAAAALRKLGYSMERWAGRISQHVLQSADVMDEAAQRHDPVYLQALEKLTLAWAECRKIQLWHRKKPNDPLQVHIFCPFYIEPYAAGQATHVIGYSDTRQAMRTFKIERIERVEILPDHYIIPEAFDPRDQLADAWGIWYTDTEPAQVTLKFNPRVAGRVQENRWHRSEQEELLPDGSLLWTARIAEPQEMLPWIRGWGSDVEVLEPADIREKMVAEILHLKDVYHLNTSGENL
jgi:predicted DNA-binding transcriptional regulator YafY